MQYVHEKYIVPALKFNTNALFTVMWLLTLSLHAVKTWSQKKELLSTLCVLNVIYFGTSSGTGRRKSACGRTRTGSKSWEGRQKRRKEARKKGRKEEINCTPTLSSSFLPTWVVLIISPLFQ